MNLEELMDVKVDTVYSASKFEQKVTNAPSYVTIISADEIAKYGFRTLADLLESVPGFYVNNDRNYDYVGVRGFARPGDYNNRILVMVDGHRLNENVYEGAYVGTEFPVDLDLVQRVEIVRGPGSALYGTDAFFAVINVITKRGRDLGGVELSASAGSLQTFNTRASYGGRVKNGSDVLFSGSFSHSLGNDRLFYPEFDSPLTNNGYAVGADGDSARNFFANVQTNDFAIQGVYCWRQKVIPTASFGTVFNDSRTKTIDARGYLDLKYDHAFENGWQILARLAFDQYNYHGTYVMDYAGTGEGPYSLNEDFANGTWLTFAVDISRVFLEKHHVTLGTEERWNPRQNQENYDREPYRMHLQDHRSSSEESLYAEDEFSIRPNLILTAGFRLDSYSGFGSTANPRTGLIYSPWQNTSLKFLYGQAYRAPNVFEMYYSDKISEEGNPKLRPEKIKTTEVILEQQLTKHTHFVIDGFYNSISDLITEQTDLATGLLQFSNLENVKGKGIDFELGGKWASGWEGRLAYTLQNARDQATNTCLSNSPKHLGKVELIAPIIQRRLFAAFDGQYLSSRQTIEGTSVGGFFIGNAGLHMPLLVRGLTLSVGSYNLFDKRYADPGGPEHLQSAIPQDGRTLQLKLTYRFKE